MSVMTMRKARLPGKVLRLEKINYELRKLPGRLLRLRLARRYVTFVETVATWVGKLAMWMLLPILGVLTYSIVAKALAAWTGAATDGAHVINWSTIWVMETAQFIVAAYYILGAGWSMRLGAHVRMDFLYSRWSPRTKAVVDACTAGFLVFYLAVMVMGGWDSSLYALETVQRNHTVWAPRMAPIKLAMTFGMLLMLLQTTAELVKDLCRAAGQEIKVRPLPFLAVVVGVLEWLAGMLRRLAAATGAEIDAVPDEVASKGKA